MVVLGTWILFIVMPFYVTRLVKANEAIVANAEIARAPKSVFRKIWEFFA